MLAAQHHHRGVLLRLLFVFALTFASLHPAVSAATLLVNERANANTQWTRRKEQEQQQQRQQQRGGTEQQSQSRYLQEILMGRCYERPPTGNHQDDFKCPSLMGSITGVILGSHLDEDVTATSFEPYFDSGADFTTPRDSAVLMLDPATQQQALNSIAPTTVPQTTHGGSIMTNLVFCAVNVRDNGTRDDCISSKTSLSFWQGAYSRFASHIQGHLRILLPLAIDDNANTDIQFKTLVLEAGIAHLSVTAISSVSIYSPSTPCTDSKLVSQVKDALTSVGISSNLVTCTENIFSMIWTKNATATCPQRVGANEDEKAICKCLQQDSTITASSSLSASSPVTLTQGDHVVGVENDGKSSRNHHYTLFFFLTVVPFAGGYILVANRMKRATASYDRVRDVAC
jgi:ADP-ribosyl cyclase